MAKVLLWMFVASGFIVTVVNVVILDEPVEQYTKIVILSCLAVLALCDSIEKGKK